MPIYSTLKIVFIISLTVQISHVNLYLNVIIPYHILSFACTSFLGKRGIKDEICMFDARAISHEVRESVEEILKSKESSFDPKVCALFKRCILRTNFADQAHLSQSISRQNR